MNMTKYYVESIKRINRRRILTGPIEPYRVVPGGFAYLVDEEYCPTCTTEKGKRIEVAVVMSDKFYMETCYKCGWRPKTREERNRGKEN